MTFQIYFCYVKNSSTKKKKDSPRETLLTIFVGTFLFFEFGIDDNSLAGCMIGEPDPDETSTGTSKGLKEAETLKSLMDVNIVR